MKQNPKKVEIPMFRMDVYLILYRDPNELRKICSRIQKNYEQNMKKFKERLDREINRLEKDNPCGVAWHPSVSEPKINCKPKYILINLERCSKVEGQTTKNLITTLSHEIRHIVDRLVDHLRITDTETPAYLTGYLSGELFPCILSINPAE